MSDFSKVLMAYGFKTREQQLDVIKLLFLSGCLELDRLHEDLNAIGFTEEQIKRFLQVVVEAYKGKSDRKDISQLDAEFILNHLSFTTYQLPDKSLWPEKLHNWLIKVTQCNFFARKAGQERWQQETGQWMIIYEKEAREISNKLRLENEVKPNKSFYEAIAVFGSTAPEMEKRLIYVKQLVEQNGITAKKLFLLCGERPADKAIDGDTEFLQSIATKYSVPLEKVTETHLMKEVYLKVKGQGLFSSLPVVYIDTPKGTKPRPTTIDTLLELTKQNPQLTGDLLFISRAPNVQAQKEDTLFVLNEKLPTANPEVVGANSENVALNRVMGAFGGALYGGYVRVAKELGCQQSRQQLESARNNLGFTIQPSSTTSLPTIVNSMR